MQPPDICNTLRDGTNNMTYHVMAYRKLSEAEVLGSVGSYLARPEIRRRKTPLRNKTVTIITIYGASPGL
jgi:hypothetical protein